MKVILTTNIKKLGKIGDLVNVKDGFARNYLFPNKMALRNNKKNLSHYEGIKDEMIEKEKEKLNQANELIDKLSSIKIVFKKEADEKDQLYGSINKKEILEFLNNNNIKVKSDDLLIKQPIKSLGEHEIEINPYVDVSKVFKIFVNKN
tara:strand:- start:1339 stop:1782 length:444 start_codon:yes stop_codon:yes gene_type:complete